MLMMSAKPVSYIPQSARLLDQLCEILRYKHYSLRTEEAYLYWVKFFSCVGMGVAGKCGIRVTWVPQRFSNFCSGGTASPLDALRRLVQ